jgi:RNA polymerase sigma-B factor
MASHAASLPPVLQPQDDGERAARDRALFRQYVDGQDRVGRDAVIERFLPLARRLALRYLRPSESFEDVYQVACLALVNAVDRFEADRGIAFSSYAVPTIVGEIKRYYRDKTWAVHVSRDLLEAALRVERAGGELSTRLGRPPTVTEIAGHLDVTEEDVLEAREAAFARTAGSLERPRVPGEDDDAATLGDTLGGVDPGFEQAEHRATLSSLARCLSARDREIIRLRMEEDLTQGAIGERIGISQMQVSRVLRGAMERLREAAAEPTRGASAPDKRFSRSKGAKKSGS